MASTVWLQRLTAFKDSGWRQSVESCRARCRVWSFWAPANTTIGVETRGDGRPPSSRSVYSVVEALQVKKRLSAAARPLPKGMAHHNCGATY